MSDPTPSLAPEILEASSLRSLCDAMGLAVDILDEYGTDAFCAVWIGDSDGGIVELLICDDDEPCGSDVDHLVELLETGARLELDGERIVLFHSTPDLTDAPGLAAAHFARRDRLADVGLTLVDEIGVPRRAAVDGGVDLHRRARLGRPRRVPGRRRLIGLLLDCGQDLTAAVAMVTRMEPTTVTDPRPQLAAATTTLRQVVAAIDPSQFDQPTPCTGMNVREVIDHVGMALGRVAAAGRREPLETWPGEGFTVGDDVVTGIDTLIADTTAAWSDDRLAEDIPLPWTTLRGDDTIAVYVNEVLVHTWDLATATTQTPTFDADAIAIAEAIMHQELPDPIRGPMWDAFRAEMPEGIPFEPPFADAVPVTGDATPVERLLAWNGRQP